MPLPRPVIIIDDDEDDQGFISDIFKDLHLENSLKFFTEGTSFLTYLRSTSDKPFLILSDISLQSAVSGLELREEIQKDTYLREKSIPFVFYTTSQGKHLLKKVYELGVQGYFIKESHYEGMREQIRMIVAYWSQCLHPNLD